MQWDLREYMNLFDRVKSLGLKSLQAVEAIHDLSGEYFIVGAVCHGGISTEAAND